MQATIDRKQLNDLIGNLRSMGDKVSDAVFDEVQASALMIESDAKKECPVKTGRLRTSIKAIWDKETFSAAVYTNVEYAPNVEFNYKPFLYPAYFFGIDKLWNNLNNVMKNVEGNK